MPVGRPIANTRVYLLDSGYRPVPMGVAGNLYAAGDGLARGYFGRPAPTAESFVPDPFGAAGSRMYRTGDIARSLPDGAIEFLGRRDQQVKIRGFRVEPGEIESALSTHPAVREAAVLAVGEGASRALVAWVVARDAKAEVEPAELRAFLRDRLPDFMVPGRIFACAALPLTTNGKVDRRALAVLPEAGTAEGERILDTPRTPVEELIAGIWSGLLGLERVGRSGDFFELGGHSLLATRLAARLQAAFGIEIPLQTVFERPTVAALAEAVEQVRRTRAAGTGTPPPLVPTRRSADLPLSFAQERLWFLDQLEPGGTAYNVVGASALSGALNAAVLAVALCEIVRRHEALRTTFHAVEGQPRQRVVPPAPVPLPVVDLTALPSADRRAESQRLLAGEANRLFDLARGPLLRATLLRLEPDEHVLLLGLHHIVSDGWSVGVLTRELAAFYAAAASGRPSPLPELPVQYGDYAVWQRQWLQGEVVERQLAWWRQALAGAPMSLDLPTDRPRPAAPTNAGGQIAVDLPSDLSKALGSLGRQHGTTLFMTLLAGWAALLSRYASAEDVLVGSPVANRTRVEVEGLIGFFVNTLVLRSDLSSDPTFAELLRRVRRATLGAYDHQDLPFERLVEELQPERRLSFSPLFQVLFALQNTPGSAVELPGLALTPLELPGGGAKFDLSLLLHEEETGTAGVLRYAAELFDGTTALRLLAQWRELLGGAAADPERRLSKLPLLAAAARFQLLHEWNDSCVEGLPAATVHELFERQADRMPDAAAVLCGDRGLTFGRLDTQANRLARRLTSLGAGAEARVALFLERSPEMAVAILGVLKAGAAFVPLDPSAPLQRLAFQIADCRPAALLTSERLRPALAGLDLPPVLCLDDGGLETGDAARPSVSVSPDHLCYVIYTSGSTGRPKGTLIPHRPVANLAAALARTVYEGAAEPQRVALNAPLVFDGSIKQVIQWLSGHLLDIVTEEVRRDPAALLGFLAERGVDAFDCTPSQLRLLLAESDGRPLPPRVLIGGEALDEALWTQLAGDDRTRFFNLYGPTECTVDTTVCRIVGRRPVLGRPLANVAVYLLDPDGMPAPPGVVGHLHVGGAGLARGYLGNPGLTASRFLPDPFAGVSSARLYATGDLARRLPDGRLEFVGRADHQVKVRGFRIELREIEAVLAGHPVVREAVVVVREDQPGDRRLAAYLVADGAGATAGELRAFLAERLPDYMVPAAFVTLPALPLTANGKLDRRRLPEPDRPAPDEGSAAPRTPAEELLAGIWAERPGARPDRHSRRLLRPRRTLAARNPGRVPDPAGVRHRPAAAQPVRGSHRGGPGGAARRGADRHALRPAAPAPSPRAGRRPAARLRAGAALVPGPAPARPADLQPALLRPPGRAARARRPRTRPERGRAPPGGPAQLVPRPRRAPGAPHRTGLSRRRAAPAPGRPAGSAGDDPADRAGAPGVCRGPPAVRSPDRSAAAAAAGGGGRGGAPPAALPAPHRLRRLVARRAAAGGHDALRHLRRRAALALA